MITHLISYGYFYPINTSYCSLITIIVIKAAMCKHDLGNFTIFVVELGAAQH